MLNSIVIVAICGYIIVEDVLNVGIMCGQPRKHPAPSGCAAVKSLHAQTDKVLCFFFLSKTVLRDSDMVDQGSKGRKVHSSSVMRAQARYLDRAPQGAI